MRDPGLAEVCKRVRIDARNAAIADDVFAGFEMPPEIAVAQRPRGKHESEDKHIHFEGSFERSVHSLCRIEWRERARRRLGK